MFIIKLQKNKYLELTKEEIDTKLNNVIFNTDEKLNYYMPFSDREMLAVTDSSIYKICAIKDANNNGCVDYCENNYSLYIHNYLRSYIKHEFFLLLF